MLPNFVKQYIGKLQVLQKGSMKKGFKNLMFTWKVRKEQGVDLV